jgi:hypothetical protein
MLLLLPISLFLAVFPRLSFSLSSPQSRLRLPKTFLKRKTEESKKKATATPQRVLAAP